MQMTFFHSKIQPLEFRARTQILHLQNHLIVRRHQYRSVDQRDRKRRHPDLYRPNERLVLQALWLQPWPLDDHLLGLLPQHSLHVLDAVAENHREDGQFLFLCLSP